MRTQKSRLMQVAALAALILLSLRAEEFTLDWTINASGTETSVGGNFELAGTIGQPFVGAVEGNDLILESGFWSVVVESRAQAPGLSISMADGRVTIEWDPLITGYLLEETSNLTAPLAWKEVPGVAQNRLTIVPAATLKIYRLRRLQ
jgi:hypothetical protein